MKKVEFLDSDSEATKKARKLIYLTSNWFMQTLLDRKDRMSMYNSLEVRVPFCDYRIAQYLYSVPWEYKDYKSYEKGLLREAMRDILPDEVLWRKKSPYPKTWDPSYQEIMTEQLQALLQQKDAPIFGIVNREAVRGLLGDHYTRPWYGQLMKVPQTMAYMLQIDCWLRQYQVELTGLS